MNINQKIQEFLTEHQYQKKRRIFTAVLSLMIVFSVVSSLIMPAISMTMQDLDDAAAVDTIDAEPAEENIMLLGESAPIDLITSSSTHEITITDAVLFPAVQQLFLQQKPEQQPQPPAVVQHPPEAAVLQPVVLEREQRLRLQSRLCRQRGSFGGQFHAWQQADWCCWVLAGEWIKKRINA